MWHKTGTEIFLSEHKNVINKITISMYKIILFVYYHTFLAKPTLFFQKPSFTIPSQN